MSIIQATVGNNAQNVYIGTGIEHNSDTHYNLYNVYMVNIYTHMVHQDHVVAETKRLAKQQVVEKLLSGVSIQNYEIVVERVSSLDKVV